MTLISSNDTGATYAETIPGTDKRLYIKIKTKPRTLFVFFSGAVGSARRKGGVPPFFSGQGIAQHLDGDCIWLDDPSTQYTDTMDLGWYAGTAEIKLQKILTERLLTLTENYHNIILAGGSGGGFAAMYYGTKIPGAKVFAVNPQTDIMKHVKKHRDNYFSTCFPEGNPDIETSVIPLIRSGTNTPIAYIQNRDDRHHVDNQAYPLITALGGETKTGAQHLKGVRFQFGDWGEGHAPLPSDKWIKCLTKMAAEDTTFVADCL